MSSLKLEVTGGMAPRHRSPHQEWTQKNSQFTA